MAPASGRLADTTALPPGTLVHVGRLRAETTRVAILDYDAEHLREVNDPDQAQIVEFAGHPSVTWVRVEGLHDIDLVACLGQAFGLHPLVQEDIVNTSQRPKVEDYGEYLYLVLRAVLWDEDDQDWRSEQISLILGPHYVLSFQESHHPLFEPIAQRIRNLKSRHRRSGPDYLAYSLIDAVVDCYFPALEVMGDRCEGLEDELLTRPTPESLKELHRLRGLGLLLRKSGWPLREVVGALERRGFELFQDSTRIYLRDAYDHVVQVMDAVDNYREMLAGMLDLYLSSISNRLNEVMKVLTIIATIFMPLSFLAGVYGMNFEFMPELKWPWGYPAALLLMACVAGGMLFYFHRKKWL
ncbi:MAG: magnesium/cobalt transporter CorA [Desulfarculus sp.]|nr:magnesium/cobalt transporter CorA [Desulfarculus sp.]